ncbi:hypothetical protein HMPREF1326_01934 [Akkermansia sp. KLE1605]|nr:hypothetical protein HMPREF1326_01934 [Akkermansia sp. KLE1605]
MYGYWRSLVPPPFYLVGILPLLFSFMKDKRVRLFHTIPVLPVHNICL